MAETNNDDIKAMSFETALGAALGEDLDVPLDRAAPVHWNETGISAADPSLPAGARPLSEMVRAPRQLAGQGPVAQGADLALDPLLFEAQPLPDLRPRERIAGQVRRALAEEAQDRVRLGSAYRLAWNTAEDRWSSPVRWPKVPQQSGGPRRLL